MRQAPVPRRYQAQEYLSAPSNRQAMINTSVKKTPVLNKGPVPKQTPLALQPASPLPKSGTNRCCLEDKERGLQQSLVSTHQKRHTRPLRREPLSSKWNWGLMTWSCFLWETSPPVPIFITIISLMLSVECLIPQDVSLEEFRQFGTKTIMVPLLPLEHWFSN